MSRRFPLQEKHNTLKPPSQHGRKLYACQRAVTINRRKERAEDGGLAVPRTSYRHSSVDLLGMLCLLTSDHVVLQLRELLYLRTCSGEVYASGRPSDSHGGACITSDLA